MLHQGKRLLLALMIIATSVIPLQFSLAAAATTPTFSSTVTSREDGFSFIINNYSSTFTYTATTTRGYVMLGYPFFGVGVAGSASNYVGIVYGLNKGDSAIVTVTASASGYTDSSAQVNGSANAVPSISACSPITTVSGRYTTLKFTSVSETADRFCDWTVPAGVTSAETITVVGGGGGGGYWGNAGSGGAGAVITRNNYPLTPGSVIRVVVGAGGAATYQGTGQGPGHNGNNSIFDGVIAAGGGGAGGGDSNHPPRFCNGFKGGSGGGTNSDASCGTVPGASIASEVCNCSPQWNVYGNAGTGTVGGTAGAAGTGNVGISFFGTTFGIRGSPSASSGNGGTVSSAGSSGVVMIRYFLQPTSSVSISTVTTTFRKGVPVQLTATTSDSGRVTFIANEKRIAGCIQIQTSGSPTKTATCNWRPTVTSSYQIYAKFSPIDSSISSSISERISLIAQKRTTLR